MRIILRDLIFFFLKHNLKKMVKKIKKKEGRLFHGT